MIHRSEDLNHSKTESPQQLERRGKSGNSLRLNRPFKSPLLKAISDQKEKNEESPTTPKVSSTASPLLRESKRNRSPFPSPVNVKNQPKRIRLSAQLRKINIEDLRRKESELDQEIIQLQQEGLSIEELDHQIDLLHRYNDIKDIAQIVMGRLAELEGVTVKTLHQKYNVPLHD